MQRLPCVRNHVDKEQGTIKIYLPTCPAGQVNSRTYLSNHKITLPAAINLILNVYNVTCPGGQVRLIFACPFTCPGEAGKWVCSALQGILYMPNIRVQIFLTIFD